ncbi:MAG: deoxyhypusine synthase family protein [Bdellovibrionales bacterium]|nr:deoxyhypusine synthase family protein [Bdellovibrionales bacterium]
MTIKEFMLRNYKHFNAATVVRASQAWVDHLDNGGKMFLAMAGAMSTAELGISLAEMIRQDKISAISTTGANLEEDIYNLIAHESYEQIPEYRTLTKKDEEALHARGLNRVTDTAIPEDEAIRKLEDPMKDLWAKAQKSGKRYFPYEFFYELIESNALKQHYQIDPENSWVVAACKKKLPIFTPGWEDSTLGNIFVSHVIRGTISDYSICKSGVEQMARLVEWYKENSAKSSVGFFQIGGGISGDFPICVVPLIAQDLQQECPVWGYYCQISDCTTSYGSYSGASPSEKITWGKLGLETPSFMIESDASIVAPLMFNYVLGR